MKLIESFVLALRSLTANKLRSSLTMLGIIIGVGAVIPGWDEAFLTMREGEKRILILPDYLGYGETGSPPVIPPRATLIFDVELLSVTRK